MKKALLLLLAVALPLPALAQKVTDKNLLGRWEMCALETSYGLVDFDLNKVTLSESKKKTVSKEEWPEIESNMLEGVSYCSLMYLEFKPKSIVKHNLDGEDEGVYSIFEKGGKQYLIEPGMPADSDEVNVYMKNSKLQLSVKDDDGSDIIMIFKAVKATPPAALGSTTKLSAKQLQGTWKLIKYEDEDGVVDLKIGKYTLAADISDRHSEEEVESLKDEFAEIAEILQSSEIVFSPKALINKLEGEETYRGDYTLETDTDTYMQVAYLDEDGEEETDLYKLYTKSNILYMEMMDGSLFIYARP